MNIIIVVNHMPVAEHLAKLLKSVIGPSDSVKIYDLVKNFLNHDGNPDIVFLEDDQDPSFMHKEAASILPFDSGPKLLAHLHMPGRYPNARYIGISDDEALQAQFHQAKADGIIGINPSLDDLWSIVSA